MISIGDYGRSVAVETAFWLAGFDDQACPLQEAGKLGRELERNFRTLAILALLANADSNLYCHHLIRSGMIRLAYLRKVAAQGAMDTAYYATWGRNEAVLAFVAAGSFPLVRDLVALSPREFRRGMEYEDDHCYYRLIANLAVDGAADEREALFERYAAYLGDDPTTRLDLVRSLASNDPEAFLESFEALLHERAAALAAREAKGELETVHSVVEKAVWIEAVALLRLADARGFPTDREYRFVPSIARAPMLVPFPGMYQSAF